MLILLTIFWFVQFTDKLGSAPIHFSDRATENRKIWNIPTDSLDYAVAPQYVDSIRAKGARVCYVSRWMNGATIEADSASAMAIGQLPFVQAVEQTRNNHKPSAISARKLAQSSTLTLTNTFTNTQQLEAYNLLPLHQLGYEGQGILMAVVDAGFNYVNTAPYFDSVRNQILGTYDFSTETTSLYSSQQHGANCLSFIAALTPTYHGAATKAEYILIRTEENDAESPKECDNLIAAYELCDSLGVNIISTSLGYRTFDDPAFDLTHDDLDGRTIRVSRAATIAARKGMLLCQSAGNDGDKSWQKISVPSDADSILTVGAIKYDTTMANFSSYGPSADGRVKPEVSAIGYQAVYWNTATNQSATGNGTSYSTPLVAGLAASLWSALPNASAMEIRQRIIQSAHLYPNHNPNNRMGYGIPDAWKAYQSSPTVLPEVQNAQYRMHNVRKALLNGELYILLDGKIYTIDGQRMQ